MLFRLWQKHLFFLIPAHPTLAANSSRRLNFDWLHISWTNLSSMVLKLRTNSEKKKDVLVWQWKYWENIPSQLHTWELSNLLYTQDSAVYHQNQRGKGETSFFCLRTSSCRRTLIKMCPPLYFILSKASQYFS